MRRFIAIDPGTSWVGIARLHDSHATLRGKTDCIDVRGWHLADIGAHLRRSITDADLCIVEDYRVRPTGFNAHSDGGTLRLLGMIEFLAWDGGTELVKVAPGKPTDALRLWKHLSADFMKHGAGDHSMSAWRIMGRYFLDHERDLLQRFTGERFA